MKNTEENNRFTLIEMCKAHLRGRCLGIALAAARAKKANTRAIIAALEHRKKKPPPRSQEKEWFVVLEALNIIMREADRRERLVNAAYSRLKGEVMRLLHNGEWTAWARFPGHLDTMQIPAHEWLSIRIELDGRRLSFTMGNGTELSGVKFALARPKSKQMDELNRALAELRLTAVDLKAHGALKRIADRIVSRFPNIGKPAAVLKVLGDIKRGSAALAFRSPRTRSLPATTSR